MKTRMLATAREKGNVLSKAAHACGFVSKMIVRSDGGGSDRLLSVRSQMKKMIFVLLYEASHTFRRDVVVLRCVDGVHTEPLDGASSAFNPEVCSTGRCSVQ